MTRVNKRFWLFWLLMFIIFVILATKTTGQDLPDNALNYTYFENGKELSIGETPILFVYGNEAFGFKDGGFQVIAATGDTLFITLKKKIVK